MKNKTLHNLIVVCCVINLLFAVSGILVAVYDKQPFVAIFITMFMFAYHADVRVVIGAVTNKLVKSRINVDKKCYTVSKKEFDFLSKLDVKKWKDKFVTLFSDQFTVSTNNIENVLKNNINAEITHHLCFAMGLLAIPLGWLISAEELWLYVATAVVASLALDLPPILIQRYNRFRLLKIKNRKSL